MGSQKQKTLSEYDSEIADLQGSIEAINLQLSQAKTGQRAGWDKNKAIYSKNQMSISLRRLKSERKDYISRINQMLLNGDESKDLKQLYDIAIDMANQLNWQITEDASRYLDAIRSKLEGMV